SRGKKVLKEVLDKDFDGTIGCDGWSSYAAFAINIAPNSNIQRCWSHLLREADDLAEKCEEAVPIAEELHRIYDELIAFVGKDPPPEEREERKEEASRELKQLLSEDYEDEEIEDLMKKIGNGFDYWFTFLTEPRVESTNNRAERALRELVIQRRIMGSIRSERGRRAYETIMTMLATWKQQKLDPYEEMLKAIRN
ncbi:transposase, partial [candidate division MSBL1 archaeon SCGC-AAA261O19]